MASLSRAPGYRFLAVASIVVIYNNLAFVGIGRERGIALWLSNAVLVVAVLGWALGVEKLRPADLGFQLAGLRRSLAWGLIAGLAMAIPPLIFFAFPIIAREPVRYQGYVGLDQTGLLLTIFVHQLLSTALCEETLFRGWMQAQGLRAFGPRVGIGLTCTLFVFWHVVVTWNSIGQTSLTASVIPVPVLYLATSIPLAVGGLIFSLIRLHTNNIGGCILAHWTVNCMMLISLAVQGSR